MNNLRKLFAFLKAIRLGFLVPVIQLCRGEDPKLQMRLIAQQIVLPLAAIILGLLLWQSLASKINTNLGTFPGPTETWQAYESLQEEARVEALKEKHFNHKQLSRMVRRGGVDSEVGIWLVEDEGVAPEVVTWLAENRPPTRFNEADYAAFLEPVAGEPEPVSEARDMDYVNGLYLAAGKAFKGSETVKVRDYGGKPTYGEQIRKSLWTVFTGFVIASLVAIPIGILCGLNKSIYSALNPFIQVGKPVSPLAWLPLVTLVVVALYEPTEEGLEISFIVSALVVALCSLWPTLVNTAVGVANTDPDHLNVARVLKLSWFSRLFKIILPGSLPLMFTGLRISLGVGWMVLIAAEMLAQNPGLGKFVWDMFQNGSSETLSLIVVACLTIGLIGFFLDTIMGALQTLVSFEEKHSS
ncbi:MAG: ABC transporter permease [Opitutales bacterium]